ncbi:MAG: EF-hand domain-containing protein [Halioglobus sp.]
MIQLSEQELRTNFDHFDRNKDGEIELDEFINLMIALNAESTREEMALGFKAIDADSSGAIDFAEFSGWFSNR